MHIVIPNAGLCRDGKYRAVEFRDVYRHQHELDRVYERSLAAGLRQRLGVEIRWSGDTFEIAGLPRALVESLTGARRREILATGARTPREREVAALRTRGGKGALPEPVELRETWRSIARAHGFDVETVLARKPGRRMRAAEEVALPGRHRAPRVAPKREAPTGPEDLSRHIWRAQSSALRYRRSIESRQVAPTNRIARRHDPGVSRQNRAAGLARGTSATAALGAAWLRPRLSDAFRRFPKRRRVVTVSADPWRLARDAGVLALTPRAFLARVRPLTHRETLRVLRGGPVEEVSRRKPSLAKLLASQRGGRLAPLAGTRNTSRDPSRRAVPQFRSLWTFLRYAEQIKRRGAMRLDSRTLVVIHEPDRLDAAELAAVRAAATRAGARVREASPSQRALRPRLERSGGARTPHPIQPPTPGRRR